ncbi:hypothetical protein [Candidatus Halobonum tyrrellensis]|uniref:Uncharacterized protein n=1 Tax=Candidatus Halobonum tyrrellensis G22 TaxID=1324957 RepID=V4HBW9_9EURY|nr:hypothetical protein [Candidatus Halobonum tyrrellensis]ESP87543.1 hypothetical protein K933_13761 [Candidatus Halobonum tyrrellensis G22]
MASSSIPRLLGVACCCLIVGVAAGPVVAPAATALPGVTDRTGATDLRVVEFEVLAAGCASNLDTGGVGGMYETEGFVPTRTANATLSAWVERTSPEGADLSTFRVHVDVESDGPTNGTCRTGVRYRLAVEPSGGARGGLGLDAYGTRVVWVVDGDQWHCSSSYTGRIDGDCSSLGAPQDPAAASTA